MAGLNPIRKQRQRATGGDGAWVIHQRAGYYPVCDVCAERVQERVSPEGYLGPVRPHVYRTRKQAKDALHKHKMKEHNPGSGEVRSTDVA